MELPLTHLPMLASPRRSRRIARRVLFWLLGGLIVNFIVAIAIASSIDPWTATPRSAQYLDSEERWAVSRFDRAGSTAVVSERGTLTGQMLNSSWSPWQAIGAPNTHQAGDQGTAWASSTTDGQIEWLELDYASAVYPKAVRVYETYNPGSLCEVVLYKEDGSTVSAWKGTDPTPPGTPSGMGMSEVPVSSDFATRKIRIYLDSPKVAGWNEIDAVGLLDRDGKTQWATRCKTSTFYGQASMFNSGGGTTSVQPQNILPGYGHLAVPSQAYLQQKIDAEVRVVFAYGWPMRTLWSEAALDTMTANTVVGGGSTVVPIVGSTTSGSLTSTGITSLRSFDLSGTTLVPGSTALSSAGIFSGGSTYSQFSSAPGPVPGAIAGFPSHPIWTGMAANTLLYAVVLALLQLSVFVPRRFIREVSRIRRGACLECGYNLGYDFQHGCSECGWRRDLRNDRPSPTSTNGASVTATAEMPADHQDRSL